MLYGSNPVGLAVIADKFDAKLLVNIRMILFIVYIPFPVILWAVLGNFVSALNQFIADRYSLNHSVSEYHVYEFFKV